MPDSIREQIVEAFAQRIGASRSDHVSADGKLPVRNVWDLDESAEKLTMGRRRMTLVIGVGVMDRAPKGVSSSQKANTMLAELLADAITQDATLGDLAEQISYTGSLPSYPQPGQDVVALECSFEIQYQTKHTTPYEK